MIFEAVCKTCGETFNPTPSLHEYMPLGTELPPNTLWVGAQGFTADDLEHGMNGDQTKVCGGEGELTGSWG